jgi:hypothetical protein
MEKCKYNYINVEDLKSQCLDQVLYEYNKNALEYLFPNKDGPNTKMIYITNILHIIGVTFFFFGILSPPRYLYIYLIYVGIIFIFHKILSNHCFLSVVAAHMGRNKDNPLKIRMSVLHILMGINIVIAIIGFLVPQLSPFNVVKSIFKWYDGIGTLFAFSPVIIVTILFIMSVVYIKYHKIKLVKDNIYYN